jgi:ABC-type phosphate transport system substrate-binding protein
MRAVPSLFNSLLVAAAVIAASVLIESTGCSQKGNKPDDQIANRSAITIAVSGTHAATAEKYAIAFSTTAAEVRSGEIKHARDLLSRLIDRTKAGREAARVQFDLQWARDMPTEAIADPAAVADKIDQYAAAWQSLSTKQ